ncbi:serine/threonine-protein kinase [Phytoactinopolyspora mesophila]|uniref:non-specific serine/threonine protein kinase n=1 Tax=Phytoactinopolyspora mesophila TaxID=2650750 RepID=A0A7K3M838_9ACTN|nr:serine/threonine-protein kinase [Phytoactinopolyspora mesophila]NDL59445.1 protein kinase [Phytoactinopolyspora mesophila]
MYGPGVRLAERYLLDELIGSGGMGEVWRATDQVLGRTVAVKVMRSQLVAQPGFAQRFLAEARAMATIKHSAVVDVYDYQGDSSTAILVMELVEGEPLSRRLHRMGRLTPDFTTALVAQTAEALQAAHDTGIVHRDVKPANLLITKDDRVVLTDFGIARSGTSAQLTATGEVVGTPSYLAPEQVLGHPATPRSDMYALGVVAYECLTGRLPFAGDNSFAVATQRLHEPPAPLDADVPPGVAALVRRMLATEPDQRWPSARELAVTARNVAAAPHDAQTVVAHPDDLATQVQAFNPPPPPAQQTAPTVAQPPPRPVPATHVLRPTPVQPEPARRPAPARREAAPARRAEQPAPSRPRRRRIPLIAGALLALAGLCLAVYVGQLWNLHADVVAVVENWLTGTFEWLSGIVPIIAWAVVAVYGFLTAMLLILAIPVALGSRAARRLSLTFGFVTLLVAAPLGVAGAFLVGRLDPEADVLRELLATIPASYPGYTIAAGLTAMVSILTALILLMSRSAP